MFVSFNECLRLVLFVFLVVVVIFIGVYIDGLYEGLFILIVCNLGVEDRYLIIILFGVIN